MEIRTKLYTLLQLIFLILFTLNSKAQNTNSTIRGTINDKETGTAVEFAAVQLLLLPDSVQVGGVASDKNGSFSLPLKRTGNYCLKVSYMGYKTIEIPFSCESVTSGDIIMNNLKMETDAIMLGEAIVTAEAPPVQVEEDTVVYNAAAYKVTEGAVLEELIEKLPGAEIDDDGKIKINGKELKKLMVNGKEFFGGDLKTGLQNLPVEMIEQLKTYDKESDMERMTGIDDGNDEVVLDVRFKKGKNRGWFGNIDAGGGTEKRYSGKAMVNKFSDETQYSLIASANNVSGKNFSSAARANWRTNRGIVETQNIGLNVALNREKYEFGGNIDFSRNNNDVNGVISSERFYTNKSTYSNSSNNTLSNNISLRGNFRIEYMPNDKTTLLIRPNISYNNGNESQSNRSHTFGDFEYTDSINFNISDNYSESVRKNMSISALLSRKIGDTGRNIGFRIGAGYNESGNDRWRDNDTHYYKITDSYGNDSVNYRSQFITNASINRNYSSQITYSEPVYGIGLFQMSYQFLYKRSESDKSTFDRIKDVELDSLGKSAQYDYFNHDISLTFKVVRAKYTLSVGGTVQPQRSVLSYEKGSQFIDTVRNVLNFAPKIDFRYRFSKTSQIKFNYHGKSSQPGMESLLPVVDNSNPLNIRQGNPGLAPSFTHNVRLNMNTYNKTNQQSVIINGSLNMVQNSISNLTQYNEETGGRTTMPVNTNGDWNGNISLGFNTALRNKKFTIHVKTTASYRNNVGYIYDSKEHKSLKNTIKETKLGGELSGAYRNSNIEISLNSAINYSFEKDEQRPFNNQEPYNFSYGASFTAFLPWSINVTTGMVNQCRRGYSDSDFNRDEFLWNAKLSKSFLSGSAVVSIEAYDILQQKSNIVRNISSTIRTIGEYNGINSYVMAHFVYRFNVFGGKKMKPKMKMNRAKKRNYRM